MSKFSERKDTALKTSIELVISEPKNGTKRRCKRTY